MSLRDRRAKEVPLHRICVFGEPGMGKTHYIGELASRFNLHWFDLENGYSTLYNLPEEYQDRINLYAIPDSAIFPVAIETILHIIKGLPVDICEEHGKVNCPHCKRDNKPTQRFCLNELGPMDVLVIDSGSQLQSSALANMMKSLPDTAKPEWDHYRNQGALVNKILSTLQHAPCHVAVATHVIESEMEDGTKKLCPLIGTAPFSRNAGKYFGHCIYPTVKAGKRVLVSNGVANARLAVSSRSTVDLGQLEQPSLHPLFGNFKYEYVVSTEQPQRTASSTAADTLNSAATAAEEMKASLNAGIGTKLTNPTIGSFLGGKKI